LATLRPFFSIVEPFRVLLRAGQPLASRERTFVTKLGLLTGSTPRSMDARMRDLVQGPNGSIFTLTDGM
jgi:hypothetical protein